MKIAQYHGPRGKRDNVRFVKGEDASVMDVAWDRIYITTLFSFEYGRIAQAIDFALKVANGHADKIFVGGIAASLMHERFVKEPRWAGTRAEVFELERELGTLLAELIQLKAELGARSIRVEEIKRELSGLTSSGLVFERAPHGGVRESIVEILEQHEQGLPLNDLAALLRRRFTGAMHPRTPSAVLNRLKKDQVVERVGRRWKLARH